MNSENKYISKFQLNERTALITGSTRGIGWEIAKGMAEAGASVYINGRVKDVLDSRCEELSDLGYDAKPALFDATDGIAVERFLSSIATPIDILVNNAAIRLRKPLSQISPEAFSEVVQANLNSVYAISRSFANRLDKTDIKGSLINITSIAGPRARPGDPAYTAAKGGLEALTRSLAVELAPRIRCNAIAPGYFATDANAAHIDNEEVKQFVENRIPLKRWGQPEEIVGAAVFLASDASSYITGHTLVIDAGLTVLF